MSKYQGLSAVLLALVGLASGLEGSGCSSDPASHGGSGGTSSGSGGSAGSGGASASGGAIGSGGALGSGGTSASGGSTGAGGALGSGGISASGGSAGSGGAAGATSHGGSTSSGGAGGATTGSGGAGASGGAGSGSNGGRTGGGGGRSGGGAGGGSAISTSITLTSPAFTEGGVFPTANSCSTSSMTGTSPELDWTAGPSGTMSYGMTLTDLNNGFVHWAIWNIPASTMTLPAVLASTAMLTTPMGASQTNRFSGSGYSGPCPGGTSHSYVFDIYAIPTATLAGMTNSTEAARDSMRAVATATGSFGGTSSAKRN